MRYFAVHDSAGNIAALTTCPPDAPPAALVPDPGQFLTEVEVPEGAIDLADPENEQRAVEQLKEFRVEAEPKEPKGKLVRKTST
jgi:hypothetical protein